MLTLKNVSAGYNGILAIHQVSLHVPSNNIVALLGPNGAGKSTLLKTISGLIPRQSGEVIFEGQTISLPPHKIVRRGIALVPERRQIFPLLTVMENLEMGGLATSSKPLVRDTIKKMFEQFPVLGRRKHQLAGTLSGGEQQMLAIARALMSHPKLLMLDEPSQGLAPLIIQELFALVKQVHEQGTTVLLVEQNARMALQIADYAYVLRQGHVVEAGTPQELLADERIISAYLGGKR